MEFTCTQENLITGLARAVPIAGRNTQLPVLTHVLLQLREGVLHVTATDLELGVHTTIPGKVATEGECAVPARNLLEYVQQLPVTHPVTLKLRDNTLHITTKGFKAQFPTASPDDFPLLPTTPKGDQVQFPAKQLCQALSRTLFTAARDDTRPEIRSVYIQVESKEVIVAATDSFRLAEERVAHTSDSESFTLLLPLPTAQEFVRLFSDSDEVVVAPHESHVTFTAPEIDLSSRLVDGSYPDYQQIIPQSFTTTGVVKREELQRALKTLTVFLPRDSRRVALSVAPDQGKITLTTGGGDAGEGRVELAFDGEGASLNTLFNIQYLLEGLQYIKDEQIQCRFVGSTDPAVMRAEGDDSYTYVVMPIQAT